MTLLRFLFIFVVVAVVGICGGKVFLKSDTVVRKLSFSSWLISTTDISVHKLVGEKKTDVV